MDISMNPTRREVYEMAHGPQHGDGAGRKRIQAPNEVTEFLIRQFRGITGPKHQVCPRLHRGRQPSAARKRALGRATRQVRFSVGPSTPSSSPSPSRASEPTRPSERQVMAIKQRTIYEQARPDGALLSRLS
jgi:hypothetical protein